jgi:acyl-CoA synthetase (AMP-forming)/AMP-acid ligase II/thioesterase domain-containing protein/acyl carrier protein
MTNVNHLPCFSGANPELSIPERLAHWAGSQPQSVALIAPGRRPLTYGALWREVELVVQNLNEQGIGRGDRVALVVSEAPEAAAAFLAVSAATACAPLNPAYKTEELRFYLEDLEPSAVIVQAGFQSPARSVAESLGVPVIELLPQKDREAGAFSLELAVGKRPNVSCDGRSRPDDVALLLHTSGTTSRPKLVLLTHKNLCVSATNIAKWLELTERDRCLNVMPLFHIHGLVGACLSSLFAGGSIVTGSALEIGEVFRSFHEYHPTWYTAVPTMHQSVLTHAKENPEAVLGHSLRFIRSCSASLPEKIMRGLESAFQVPVVEAYGMTEASHQIASNPLPPLGRKAGSVGLGSGTEVAIMADDGNLMARGEVGEIVIRGANVTSGYANNPEANEKSFVNRWFRTGDQGYIDEDGYLFINGRIKEIINRGGEKISPREVDDVLLQHPAVAQAATFAVPHRTLGEDIAAAIVLAPGQSVKEQDIRCFVASRVAEFKVPRQIVIIDAIPKGPTGKLQRLDLAALLRGKLKPDFVAPQNETEKQLATIWSEMLGLEQVSMRDDFFALGGDSLVAARLFARINKMFGMNLPLVTLIESPTIETLAEVLQGTRKLAVSSCLVPIRSQGRKPPFFCVHGPGGQIVNYAALAAHWDSDQPFYGVQARAVVDGEHALHTTVEEMASHYVLEIRKVQPRGPYFLGGFCFGGQIAFEMAHQLQREGESVALVALMESFVRQFPRSMAGRGPTVSRNFGRIARKIFLHLKRIPFSRSRDAVAYLEKRIKNASILARLSLLRNLDWVCQTFGGRLPAALRLRDLTLIHYQAGRSYVTKPFSGPVALFLAKETVETSASDPRQSWEILVGCIETYELSCSHDDILSEPNVQTLAEKLRKCIDRELGRSALSNESCH